MERFKDHDLIKYFNEIDVINLMQKDEEFKKSKKLVLEKFEQQYKE